MQLLVLVLSELDVTSRGSASLQFPPGTTRRSRLGYQRQVRRGEADAGSSGVSVAARL